MAPILQLIGGGKVIGVDIDIRPHNRETIEHHPMAKRVQLIEVRRQIRESLPRCENRFPVARPSW
jgi:cephalosporin hydroxylase